MSDPRDTMTATKGETAMSTYKSEPVALFYGGSATVTARPIRKGHQLAPEVAIRERGIEVLSMSPEAARALADALRDAADHADGYEASWTQAEAEIEVRDALIDRTDAPVEWEGISDAVDVHLGRIERDESRAIDREKIDRETMFAVVEAVVQDAEQ